ncbi:hypothetical protein NM688_g2262 [Phlebia brevispora]|uniref:Uncharacterized protein n=1 Tax=Phlebia brevispora TaxID=194682 RepID=A0ACC1T917_9APHY|nr:hypothetical protein NM688_g2262 [Phlebia brevispora]
MTDIHDLPEELLAEILGHVLCLPPTLFAGFEYHDFFTSDASYKHLLTVPCPRQLSVLLVCKRWHRIGLPLLYETVVLKTPEHTNSVLNAITETPHLGDAIKRIAISGGVGAPLAALLSLARGVRTLKLQIEVDKEEDVSGICRGLAMVAPSRLMLDVRPMRYFNQKEQEVVNALVSVIPQWTSLTRVDLVRSPDPWFFYALQKSPSLQYLCLSRFEVYSFMKIRPCSDRILALPTFKCVIARDLNPTTAKSQRKEFEKRYPQNVKYIISDQGERLTTLCLVEAWC